MSAAFLLLLAFLTIPALLFLLSFQIGDSHVVNKDLQIRRIKQACIERFGHRIRPHRGQLSIPNGISKWHIVRREDISEYEHDLSPLVVTSVLLIQDQDAREYFVTISCPSSDRPANIEVNAI